MWMPIKRVFAHWCKAKWWPGGRLGKVTQASFAAKHRQVHPLATIRQGTQCDHDGALVQGGAVAEVDGFPDHRLGHSSQRGDAVRIAVLASVLALLAQPCSAKKIST